MSLYGKFAIAPFNKLITPVVFRSENLLDDESDEDFMVIVFVG